MLVRMKLYFISVWTLLDPVYYLFTRLKYIDRHQSIFRVRLTNYKGFPVTLSDGTVINKNDILIKIHLHNIRLIKEMYAIKSETAKGRVIYNKVKEGLPGLADFVNNHPKRDEIKGLIGITMLNKGCKRLGFDDFSLKNRLYRLVKQMVFIPMYYLTVPNISKASLKRDPKYLFMSKECLMTKYLKK